ncbi:hypothetical protein DPEC_G00184540 [Dallia pectoralis]|uniref:Uncharacterized protein n=1 Tax=Dallia pectoralis TaxID=75939 RepID=A0ACC2GBB0_DALPE|nr:hypothetical protein DPEC_G00184540 [Dallia pectoralis]
MIYQWSLVLNILLGTPALVWCLWISLSESISGGLKPTQIFPMNLFIVELVFCIEFLLEVICCQILPGNSMLFQVAYHVFIIGWICRPLFQFCICVERYMAVVQPVAFIKYRLSRYRERSRDGYMPCLHHSFPDALQPPPEGGERLLHHEERPRADKPIMPPTHIVAPISWYVHVDIQLDNFSESPHAACPRRRDYEKCM